MEDSSLRLGGVCMWGGGGGPHLRIFIFFSEIWTHSGTVCPADFLSCPVLTESEAPSLPFPASATC